jgi:hypothetical protein
LNYHYFWHKFQIIHFVIYHIQRMYPTLLYLINGKCFFDNSKKTTFIQLQWVTSHNQRSMMNLQMRLIDRLHVCCQRVRSIASYIPPSFYHCVLSILLRFDLQNEHCWIIPSLNVETRIQLIQDHVSSNFIQIMNQALVQMYI